MATALGLSSGMALHPYVINVLAPHLVQAMGWSKADFALAAMVSGIGIFSYPVVGRLADRFGVRRIGAIGIAASSLSYAAIAMLNGPVMHYVAILLLQLTLGVMTTGPVFLRLIVRSFDRSRGIALALVVSTPPAVAAFASPLLAAFVEAKGWRSGAWAVALYALVAGMAALVLLPRERGVDMPAETQRSAPPRSGILALFGNREYRILLTTTVLVSIPLVIAHSQLALVLMDNGMTMATAGSVVGIFAIGTVIGRMIAGLALDRFAAEVVGAVSFSLPAIGMLLIASPFDQPMVLSLALLIIGLAFGAEGDVLAYIVSRRFELENYGVALGTLFAAVGAASMFGAFAMSQSLHHWNGYIPFLLAGSVSAVTGALLLLRLRDIGGAKHQPAS